MENKNKEVAVRLNESVLSVINSDKVVLFEKANMVARAMEEIKTLLTPEYMKPIMNLQGNRLGFRTDKDKNGGYPMETVKNCIIEATLMGLQVCGNQFNIIAGNTYATKEGLGYLLNNFPGLKYDLVCSLPKVNADKTGAAVDVSINYSLNGGPTNSKVIPIAIKMDSYTSVDAIIGKATRKGRKWLYDTITGSEIPEGDVTDAVVISSVIKIDADELQFVFENKKDMLSPDDVIHIERILKNKEEKSYAKVKQILEAK